MKLKIESGELRIDVQELIQSMDQETKTNVARHLVASEQLFKAVLECVTTGAFHLDDGDGNWWFCAESVAKLREQLIPLMPEVTRELVREVLRQRDSASQEERRWRDAYWKVWHAFPTDHWRRRPEAAEWAPTPTPTDEAVDAALTQPTP